MASPEPSGRPPLARRSTFQRMLDLERKNKVKTMQAPTHPDPAQHARRRSIIQQPATSYKPDRRPISLQPNNPPLKAQAPKLSVSIPQPNVPEAESTKKYVIKSGSVVSQEKADGGSESDRSSICRSPGWDDITGSKRKKEKQAAKEKRKSEKKKKPETDSEAKHAERMKNRLSKPPPTGNRLTKLVSAMDRSPSSPTLQTASEPLGSKQDNQRPTGTRSRRGSIDIALKSLLNVKQGLPGLWKNSPTTAPQPKSPQENLPSSNGNGFIGGLKLRLSEQVAAQNKAQDSSMKGSEQQGSLDTEKDSPSDTSRKVSMGSSSKAPSLRHKPPLTSMYQESKRIPQDPRLSYSQAGRPAQEPGGSNQVLDRKLDHKNNSSTSEQHAQAQPHPSSRFFHQESSRAAKSIGPLTSQPKQMDHVGTNVGRPPSQSSAGKLSLNHRERSPSSVNDRDSSSHGQNQRPQSRGRAGTYVEDGPAGGSFDSATRRSPSFHSVKSRVSSEIPTVASQPSTVDFNPSIDRRFETRRPFSFFSEYTPPSLELSNNSSVSLPQQPGSRGRKSLDSQAGYSLRRQSIAAQLTEKITNSGEMDTSAPSQSSRRPSTSGAMDGIVALASKAQGVLGGVIQSFTQDSSQQPPSSDRTPVAPLSEPRFQYPREPNGHLETSASSHKDGSGSHVRSATDSSEEYSTLDEFSNATTPMASRPQSQREYSPGTNGVKLRAVNMQDAAGDSSSSLPRPRKKSRVKPGVMPHTDSVNRNRESWSRSAMPIDFVDGEDKHNKSTGNLSLSNSSEKRAATFTSSRILQEPSKVDTSELHHQSNYSRSASTPDLQDLSFLPALRHQALTKPPDNNGKDSIDSKKGKQLASSRQPENKQALRPPPMPLSGTKSAGNSPDSPTGGQYLRDARLNIPRAPGSPNRTRFPNSSTSQLASAKPQPATEPIAKMLVVCCSCKYFHDMPSKIYECMAKPDNVVEDKALGVSGVISTSVKCPWCGHGMSTACCAGYAAVVYLSEKLH